MELATITMDRKEARKAFLEYRSEVRARHSQEDEELMRGYKALAAGHQLLNLRDAVHAGGFDDKGLPRIAVMQADMRWCYIDIRQNGTLRYFCEPFGWNSPSPNRRRGLYRINSMYPRQRWTDNGLAPARPNHSNMRTQVPIVPPALRPTAHLRNYAVLWEVEEWKAYAPPRPPGDPALLKHLYGDMYAVLAVWDLTPLEQAILGART